MNDNIIFEKVWQDGELIELKITAISEYVSAYQNCYVEKNFLEELPQRFKDYIDDYGKENYIEFGKKEGNFTPAFSMNILPADSSGHVRIEVDMEIADNDTRVHRCCFYVSGELGQIEKLGKSLGVLGDCEIGQISSLCYLD